MGRDRQNHFSELSLSYDLQEMFHGFGDSWSHGQDAVLEWIQRRSQERTSLDMAAHDAIYRREDATDPEEREMLGELIADAYRRHSCDAVLQRILKVFQETVKDSRSGEAVGARVNRAIDFEAKAIMKLLFNEWRDHGKTEVKKSFINREEAEFVREILANEHTSNWHGSKSHDESLDKIVLTEKDGKTTLTMPAAMLMEILEIEQRFNTYKGRHM